MTATTRAEHVRHATNAALHEYACDLAAIREMWVENGHPPVAHLFRSSTERATDEIARLERFGAAEAEAWLAERDGAS